MSAFGAHGKNFARGQNEVVVVGQELGFSVVDEEGIESGKHLGQIFTMAGDPVVHGVAAHHANLRHLCANIALQHGIDVGEKEEFAIVVSRRHLRGKLSKTFSSVLRVCASLRLFT